MERVGERIGARSLENGFIGRARRVSLVGRSVVDRPLSIARYRGGAIGP